MSDALQDLLGIRCEYEAGIYDDCLDPLYFWSYDEDEFFDDWLHSLENSI